MFGLKSSKRSRHVKIYKKGVLHYESFMESRRLFPILEIGHGKRFKNNFRQRTFKLYFRNLRAFIVLLGDVKKILKQILKNYYLILFNLKILERNLSILHLHCQF